MNQVIKQLKTEYNHSALHEPLYEGEKYADTKLNPVSNNSNRTHTHFVKLTNKGQIQIEQPRGSLTQPKVTKIIET